MTEEDACIADNTFAVPETLRLDVLERMRYILIGTPGYISYDERPYSGIHYIEQIGLSRQQRHQLRDYCWRTCKTLI